ncbi:MAG TPA: hypothetical protein PLP27_06280 [Crocinitomicaceae bacterium]|nr:hypothetical protein [Crocinitomicaceae bacterium]
MKKIILSLAVFMMVFTIYSLFRDRKENQLLEYSRTTTAILIKVSQGSPKSPSSGHFKYTIKGKEYKFSQSGDYYKDMNIGDTVFIKYAIEAPSVARVIDRYYMQKYKHLKKNEKTQE